MSYSYRLSTDSPESSPDYVVNDKPQPFAYDTTATMPEMIASDLQPQHFASSSDAYHTDATSYPQVSNAANTSHKLYPDPASDFNSDYVEDYPPRHTQGRYVESGEGSRDRYSAAQYEMGSNTKVTNGIKNSERPYSCTATGCPQTFQSPKDQRRHTNDKHIGARPFPCPYIGCEVKAFKRKDGLKRHMQQQHGYSEDEVKQHVDSLISIVPSTTALPP